MRRKKRNKCILIVNFYEIQNKIKLKLWERKIQEIGQKFNKNFHALKYLKIWRIRTCRKRPYKIKEKNIL